MSMIESTVHYLTTRGQSFFPQELGETKPERKVDKERIQNVHLSCLMSV